MPGFEELRELSNVYNNELRRSAESFSARTTKDPEDAVSRKIRDMKLFSSKLKLLQAKPLSSTSQVNEKHFDNFLDDYGDTVMWKLIENITVKSLTQAHAVKALITAPDATLDAEMKQRKKAIMDIISEYHYKERELQKLDAQLKQREAECAKLTAQWDKTVGTMRDLKENTNNHEVVNRGPLYSPLSVLVEKLEMMRWLMGHLVTSRVQNYDWLEDPHRRLSALALSRMPNTVDLFTSMN